jgi:hypothetical protein
MMYLVKGEILQAIAVYLRKQPFGEVAGLMAQLAQLKPVPAQQAEPADPYKDPLFRQDQKS